MAHRHSSTSYSLPLAVAMMAAVAGSCSAPEDPSDRVLARAYDQQLNWSDLRQVIPWDAEPEDSSVLAHRFIESWVQQQVLLHMAESNTNTDPIDLDEQMEEYRRSLVIFNYEQALVDQKLDTAISDQDIQAYYEGHKANFELKDNIVRARWFKVNEPDRRVVRRMEDRFLSGKSEQLHEVELWLAQLGVSIIDRSRSWTPYSEIQAEVPMSDPEANELLKRNGKRVIKEGSAAWFVDILEHKAMNSVSPLELVRQDIRSILLNQRKLSLISGMRENVYKQALERKDVEVYQ